MCCEAEAVELSPPSSYWLQREGKKLSQDDRCWKNGMHICHLCPYSQLVNQLTQKTDITCWWYLLPPALVRSLSISTEAYGSFFLTAKEFSASRKWPYDDFLWQSVHTEYRPYSTQDSILWQTFTSQKLRTPQVASPTCGQNLRNSHMHSMDTGHNQMSSRGALFNFSFSKTVGCLSAWIVFFNQWLPVRTWKVRI